jgi:hypothetical protein
MKRLSIRSLVLLLAMFMIAGAWSPAHSVKAAPKAKVLYTPYYFYYQPYDEFWGYETTQQMESDLAGFGGLVDTNPSNGTLIATGYMDMVCPHDLNPSVYLYIH